MRVGSAATNTRSRAAGRIRAIFLAVLYQGFSDHSCCLINTVTCSLDKDGILVIFGLRDSNTDLGLSLDARIMSERKKRGRNYFCHPYTDSIDSLSSLSNDDSVLISVKGILEGDLLRWVNIKLGLLASSFSFSSSKAYTGLALSNSGGVLLGVLLC
jgi:hypothetical protein